MVSRNESPPHGSAGSALIAEANNNSIKYNKLDIQIKENDSCVYNYSAIKNAFQPKANLLTTALSRKLSRKLNIKEDAKMIEDISKSIKANMYERASSPLFGAFAISWTIWNYKTVLAIFSSLKLKEKIAFIETEIYKDEWSWALDGAIFPLTSAVLFILIYPHPAKLLYRYWNNQQKALKKIKQQIEDDTPLTIEESRQIRRELFRLEIQHEDEMSRKNNEIERLKNSASDLNERIKQLAATPTLKTNTPAPDTSYETFEDIDSNEQIVLMDIAQRHGWINDENYFEDSSTNRVKIEFYLEDLESKGYLRRSHEPHRGGYTSSLTTKGKRFAIESGAIQ